jgi:diaminopimelate epimerase
MRTFAVAKVHGTGNDFVLLDNVGGERLPFGALARLWCARRYGIGADGLLVLEAPSARGADIAMRIFNADGSEAEMCGNGIRCVARYLAQRRPSWPRTMTVQTAAGLVRTTIQTRAGCTDVSVDMGVPRLARRDIPMRGEPGARVIDEPVDVRGATLRLCALSMGNPHCVTFTDEPVERVDLAAHAAALERLDLFPHGANYEVARVAGGVASMRVLERGVGETQACGSGACAVGVAAILTGRTQTPVTVTMPGGPVRIEWAGEGKSVVMTGGAEIVYRAEIDAPDELFDGSPSSTRPQ